MKWRLVRPLELLLNRTRLTGRVAVSQQLVQQMDPKPSTAWTLHLLPVPTITTMPFLKEERVSAENTRLGEPLTRVARASYSSGAAGVPLYLWP